MTAFDPASLGVPLVDAGQLVADAWAEGWRILPPMSISEWAEEYRFLPQQSSAEPGKWRNDRNPCLVEIMDCLSPSHPCEKVVLRKSTQIGGTEVLINVIGYYSHYEPAPVMLAVPGKDMAERHSKQRIAPSIDASPKWRKVIPPARGRDSGNTTLVKEYPGGLLVIVTVNSSTGIRSMPARIVLMDEVSKYIDDEEGNKVKVLTARTTTYQGSRKLALISSPTIKGACRIDAEYEDSDQRLYYVPCPHCGHEHTWEVYGESSNLQADGLMVCPGCGSTYGEEYKSRMVAAGRWVARHPERSVPGFALNAAYAPYCMGDSWVSIAQQRSDCAKKPDDLVTFVNTIAGLAYEGERDRADADELKNRAEMGLATGIVPDGYFILSMGVDCQIDRFEVQTIAWGRAERAFVVEYAVIPGDPSKQDGYDDLDAYLQQPFSKRGRSIVARIVAIDGGNWTEEVAKFVRSRQRRMIKCDDGYQQQDIVLCRGRSKQSGRIVNRPAKAETNRQGKTIARSVGVWGVGTDAAKTLLMGRIKADAEAESDDEQMIRWPGGCLNDRGELRGNLHAAYFRGLTAEYFDLKLQRWIHDKSIPNEPTDTLVYAYFAVLHPNVRLDMIRDKQWESLEESWEGERTGDLFASTARPKPAPGVWHNAQPSPDTELPRIKL